MQPSLWQSSSLWKAFIQWSDCMCPLTFIFSEQNDLSPHHVLRKWNFYLERSLLQDDRKNSQTWFTATEMRVERKAWWIFWHWAKPITVIRLINDDMTRTTSSDPFVLTGLSPVASYNLKCTLSQLFNQQLIMIPEKTSVPRINNRSISQWFKV